MRQRDGGAATGRTSVESLLFEIAAQRFALPLHDVLEVVRAVAIRPLPAAPSITLGIIDVRGEIIPVLDVRVRFGLAHKPVEIADQFLVVQAGPRHVALHVDAALGIEMLAVLHVEDAQNLPPQLSHITGVAATESGLVLIHDLRAFLDQAEAYALDTALESVRRGEEQPSP